MPSLGKSFDPQIDRLGNDNRIRIDGKKITQENRRVRNTCTWFNRLITRKHYSKSTILNIMHDIGQDSIQYKNVTPEFIENYSKLIQQAKIDNSTNKKKYPFAIQRFIKAKKIINLEKHEKTLASCKLKKYQILQPKPKPDIPKTPPQYIPPPAGEKPINHIDWADLADPEDKLLTCIGEAFNIYDIYQFLGCINKNLKIDPTDSTTANWDLVLNALKLSQVKNVMKFETEIQFRNYLSENSARFTSDILSQCFFVKNAP